jgi:hypothetical protein
MDNVVGVAIVHTLEDLLHQHGGILLREFSTSNDLVKELSTFADPRR